ASLLLLRSPTTLSCIFSQCSGDPRAPPSFPTRRSSDLGRSCWCAAAPSSPDARFSAERSFFAIRSTRPSSRRCSDEASSFWRHRSEEHTSELQSRENLVCRLLLEKKKQSRSGVGHG